MMTQPTYCEGVVVVVDHDVFYVVLFCFVLFSFVLFCFVYFMLLWDCRCYQWESVVVWKVGWCVLCKVFAKLRLLLDNNLQRLIWAQMMHSRLDFLWGRQKHIWCKQIKSFFCVWNLHFIEISWPNLKGKGMVHQKKNFHFNPIHFGI